MATGDSEVAVWKDGSAISRGHPNFWKQVSQLKVRGEIHSICSHTVVVKTPNAKQKDTHVVALKCQDLPILTNTSSDLCFPRHYVHTTRIA
jgi:hypothetical protein